MTSILLQPKSIPTPVDLAVRLKPELKTRAVSGAIFLQQMHYWISKGYGKVFEGVRYIYNTYDQWCKELPWLTEWDFRKVVFKLRELELIKFEQLGDYGRDRTGYYTINYDHDWLKLGFSSSNESSDGSESNAPIPSEDTGTAPSEDYPRHTDTSSDTSQKIATNNAVAAFSIPEENTGTPPVDPHLPQSPEIHPACENDSGCQTAEPDVDFFSRKEEEELEALGVNLSAAKAQIQDYKASVAGALAYLKWASSEWVKGVKSPTGVFIDACKKGLVPTTPCITSGASEKEDSTAQDTDWTLHPDWEEWLAQMRQSRFHFLTKGTCFDKDTRVRIANWAEANNLVWVGDYAL